MNRLKNSLRHLKHQGLRSWLVDSLCKGRLSQRTREIMVFELQAARLPAQTARLERPTVPKSRRLHFGAGSRSVNGWHNIDAFTGDQLIDLRKSLPFKDGAFDVVVSQHVIEHLALEEELSFLFQELNRVMVSGGVMFLSTPDMLRLCQDYVTGNAGRWLASCRKRHPQFNIGEVPPSHMVNYTFHQRGEHKNLFDLQLLTFCLERAGFTDVQQISEAEFCALFPEFPTRQDDDVSLYVSAKKP